MRSTQKEGLLPKPQSFTFLGWVFFRCKFSITLHLSRSWPCTERLVTNEVTSGTSQSFMFLFCLLDVRIALPTSICFFLVEENSSSPLKQQLPELGGFRDSWLDITTHSKTQTLFCTDTWSSSLGVAEAGTLKLNLRALKCQNPISFLRIPFYTL